MSVFLTPRLQPFFGGTYYPHDAFLALAHKIHEVFASHRDEVDQQAKQIAAAVAAEQSASSPRSSIDATLARAAARQGLEMVDQRFGGFRSRMKFPTPLRWSFLLHDYRRHGEEQVGAVVHQTLRAMQAGGLHDHVGGGFHRYTVDPDWTVPHFEKMLYDNAQMASLFVEAAAVFADETLASTARDTFEFLLRDLAEEQGGFSASLDADSGGREGVFYVFTRDELLDVAGPDDGPALAMLLGASEAGNFEGSNVLTRRIDPAVVASHFGRDVRELQGLFDRWRTPLREQRSRRIPPGRDHKVVTSWNGLVLSAFSKGYGVLGDATLLDAAIRTADFLWHLHRKPDGSLFRATNDCAGASDGILDDYAFLANGMLDVFQASGAPRFLEHARSLADFAVENFNHPDGGFYLTSARTEAPLGRKTVAYDAVEPSGQSALVHALITLSALTGSQGYLDRAREAVESQSDKLGSLGLEMAWWADAVLRMTAPSWEVVIAGDPADSRTGALVREVTSLGAPYVVLARVPGSPHEESASKLLAITQGKTARHGVPTAYVCRFGACNAPTQDPKELRTQIMAGWAR